MNLIFNKKCYKILNISFLFYIKTIIRNEITDSKRRNKIMKTLPNCPKCNSEYTYEDGNLMVCPDCSYECNPEIEAEENTGKVYKDVNGNVLVDGDTVSAIKDLKVKGSSLVVKKGTKVRNIKLVDADHDIKCKIDGIGSMELKTEFVKKI